MDKKEISKYTLLRLAADKGFNGIIAYVLIWDLILLVFCLTGGMTAIGLLCSVIFADIIIIAIGINYSFKAKCGWHNCKMMHSLLKNRRWLNSVKGAMLTHQNNGWEHINEKWFIRVNKNSACLLFAPEIDFTEPVKRIKNRIYDDFAGKQIYAPYKDICSYTFQTVNIVSVTIQTDEISSLYKWVYEHGGHIILQ